MYMNNLKYNCDNCGIHTDSKQIYNRHILRKRHIQMQEIDKFTFVCDNCKKRFKGQPGLWHHSKKCKKHIQINIEELTEKVDKITDLLVDLKDNQQPTNTLITQTHNNNNNLNNFNVNLFLNENVTQARNLMDMINDIQLDTEYHDYISSSDYVNTIVRMIKSELDKLPILERPIQCIKNEDENQQIIHVRHNNKWNKETELEWTQQIHNYYIDDDDEPEEDDRKIIFYAIKKIEDNIIEQIEKLYRHTGKLLEKQREYKYEMDYVPNKMRIIKSLIEHINFERDEIIRIIDEAYKQIELLPKNQSSLEVSI